MDTSRASGVEILPTLQGITAKRPSSSVDLEYALHMMSVPALAEHSAEAISNFRRRAPYDECYCLELFRRATLQGDQLAWECLQQICSEIIYSWLRLHPSRAVAYGLDSEENYVAQAFERFWRATTHNQRLEFRSVAAALEYLRASLNSAILDTIRAHSRHKEVALPEPGFPEEPIVEEGSDSSEIWEIIKKLLHDKREQRLAHLLFYCGLKPREVIRFCPQEFSDVHEVNRLRRNIIQRLQRNVYRIRQRPGLP